MAFTHGNAYGESYFSFVNGQYTNDGGSHQSAFREGLLKGVNEFAKKSYAGEDVRDGIVAAIAVTVGGIAAYVLYGAGEVDEAVDWGELGLAWLLPTLLVGGLGMWILSRRAASASSREGGASVSGSSRSDLSGAALGSPGVDPSTRR